MGAEKVNVINDGKTRKQAMQHILQDVSALEKMLDDGLFETDIQRIGAEQEIHFTGRNWRAAPVAMQILEELKDDPRFTTELAKFNMEINLDPLTFEGECLRRLEHDLYVQLKRVEMTAQRFDTHATLVGVLPSIRQDDIDLKNLTPVPRYKIMMDTLSKLRNGNFDFRIEGTDQLVTSFDHPMFESVTASFQVHYQLAPENFSAAYNWAQAITGPLLASATNSPILLGRRLWRESRIALFQQSTDVRHESQHMRQSPPRVSFGEGWVGNSVLDIFRNIISRHRLLLVSTRQENALEVLENGGIPKLYGLSVHNGTVYKWNRACYGITDGKPHLRIENRVLPSGPTIVDEVANAAFWLGMMHGLPEEYAQIANKMEFDAARGNFLRAARQGLGASFFWMDNRKRISADELILKELLPIAKSGLEKAKLLSKDIDHYLGIIEDRVKTGKTGSQWLVSSFEKLIKKGCNKNDALSAVTGGMSKRQQLGQPVHTWHLANLSEAGNFQFRFNTVDQIMTTDLFTVLEDDLIEYVANIMNWRNIRHVLVENDKGKLVGLISSKNLLHFFANKKDNNKLVSVRDIMTKDLHTITPNTKTNQALKILGEFNISCLPVVQNEQLIGLVTERDFVRLSEEIIQELTYQDEDVNTYETVKE